MTKFSGGLLALLVLACPAFAQTVLEGKVIDAQTKEPLPGVAVRVPRTNTGTTTGSNGSFRLPVTQMVDSLTYSFIGYQPLTLPYRKADGFIRLTPSTAQLNGVIVSASREAQSRTEAPVAISTLSPQVLGETKATSLEQVLNKVSGVYMVDLGNEQHSMAIRQPISTRSVFLYLEDGIPIRTSGDFNHNALIEINQAALKTIEVIRGPASSLYGSEAIGGAVNFITQAPSAVPTASVQAEAGTGATAAPGCKPRAPGAGWVFLRAPTTRGNATAFDSTATTTNWPSRSGPTTRSANAPSSSPRPAW